MGLYILVLISVRVELDIQCNIANIFRVIKFDKLLTAVLLMKK